MMRTLYYMSTFCHDEGSRTPCGIKGEFVTKRIESKAATVVGLLMALTGSAYATGGGGVCDGNELPVPVCPHYVEVSVDDQCEWQLTCDDIGAVVDDPDGGENVCSVWPEHGSGLWLREVWEVLTDACNNQSWCSTIAVPRDTTGPIVTVNNPTVQIVLDSWDVPNWTNVAEACGLEFGDNCTPHGSVAWGIAGIVPSDPDEVVVGDPGYLWSGADGILADWFGFGLCLNRERCGPRSYTLQLRAADAASNHTDAECEVEIVDTCDEHNQHPVAICKPHVEIPVDEHCNWAIPHPEVFDDGSFDPDGDPIRFKVHPEHANGLQITAITLQVIDACGQDDACDSLAAPRDVSAPTMMVAIPEPELEMRGDDVSPIVNIRDLCGIDYTDNCAVHTSIGFAILDLESSDPDEVIAGDPGFLFSGPEGILATFEEVGVCLNRNRCEPRDYTFTIGAVDPDDNLTTETCTLHIVDNGP